MFWNFVSPMYDFFENVYNHKVYVETGRKVAELINEEDEVLECACGTGAISEPVAQKCKKLIATDFSTGMLRQAAKKCRKLKNVRFAKADITKLPCRDNRFDAVIAGNVIHLLDEPGKALEELLRVVKPGGRVIIPTYINDSASQSRKAVKFFELLGADFKRQFDIASYKDFFEKMGYTDVVYTVVEGRMSCAVAVIEKSL